jgi:hypothetical protein
VDLGDLEKAAKAVQPGNWRSYHNFSEICTPERVLALITCVLEADKMCTPALVGNRDRVRDYEAARADLGMTFI